MPSDRTYFSPAWQWLWRRSRVRVGIVVLASLALALLPLALPLVPDLVVLIVIGALLGSEIGRQDPSRLNISRRLLSSWRDHFQARVLLLVGASLPPILTLSAIRLPQAQVSGTQGDVAFSMLHHFFVMLFFALLISDWGSLRESQYRALTPAIFGSFLLVSSNIWNEGPVLSVTIFLVLTAYFFTKAQAASYWLDESPYRKAGALLTEPEEGEFPDYNPTFFGYPLAPDAPLYSKPSGEPWYLFLFIKYGLVFPPWWHWEDTEAYFIAGVGTMAFILAKSLTRLRFGDEVAFRRFNSIIVGLLIAMTILFVFYIFTAILPQILYATIDFFKERAAVPDTVPASVESPAPAAPQGDTPRPPAAHPAPTLAKLFFYLVVLGIWVLGEKLRSESAGTWQRQLPLLRRLPLGRGEITGRLGAAIRPTLLGCFLMVQVAAFFLVGVGMVYGNKPAFWFPFLYGTLAALPVLIALYVASGATALGLAPVHQFGLGLTAFVALSGMLLLGQPYIAVAAGLALLFGSVLTVYLRVGPGGVLGLLARPLHRFRAIYGT